MERKWWSKFAFLLVLTVFCIGYIYPSLTSRNLENSRLPFKKKINLGLDLQGGLYMVMGVNFNRVYAEIVENQTHSLKSYLGEKGFSANTIKTVKEGYPEDDPRVRIELQSADAGKLDEVANHIKERFQTLLRLTRQENGILEYGIEREYRGKIREHTIDQSIEVIRNRIDEFGVTEPTIASQGSDRIIVELPGVKDVERAKRLIGDTAKLEFKMVNDSGSTSLGQGGLEGLVADIEQKNNLTYKEGEKFSDYVKKMNEAAKGKIPADSEIAFERVKGINGEVIRRLPYLLFSKVEVTGEELADAQVGFDENRRPDVSFSFNPKGAMLFEKLTEANIRKRLAIVLDGNVITAPVINSKIGANGRIELGRGDHNELVREASDLAIQLRAGALPAQLDFLEERVVGPTLGQDSIQKGVFAGIVGSILVFLFMIFIYRVSGLIAVASLVLNVIFVMAILIGIDATLTLPGIAGIALTVGIAVDSNVVIYERIREEIRAGKSLLGALEAGFQKAFHTILDANVTNAAASVVLLTFGTGPIKGFAVTMLIGIITTLFTAIFVCKMIFDLYVKKLEGKPATALSI